MCHCFWCPASSLDSPAICTATAVWSKLPLLYFHSGESQSLLLRVKCETNKKVKSTSTICNVICPGAKSLHQDLSVNRKKERSPDAWQIISPSDLVTLSPIIMRWKITILETKLIFNGPVFHFHDCGRKSRWCFLIFTTASTMASCTSAVAPQWLAQPETLRCGFVKALYVPLFPRIRESYRQTNTSSAKTINNISNQPWFHNLSQEIWSNLMALNWKSLGSQPRCLPYNQRKKKKHTIFPCLIHLYWTDPRAAHWKALWCWCHRGSQGRHHITGEMVRMASSQHLLQEYNLLVLRTDPWISILGSICICAPKLFKRYLKRMGSPVTRLLSRTPYHPLCTPASHRQLPNLLCLLGWTYGHSSGEGAIKS